VAGAIEKIVEQSGRFDGMIANAGMTRHQPALDFSMAQVEQLFKLNVSRVGKTNIGGDCADEMNRFMDLGTVLLLLRGCSSN
jgi:NAD(P)-dependent dehydrogenase (short-subunit alcohol dehydrogenase family)